MPCTRQMFGNKSVAVLACQAQFALQRNWFPDPIQVTDNVPETDDDSILPGPVLLPDLERNGWVLAEWGGAGDNG